MAPDRRTRDRWRYLAFVLYRSRSAGGEGHLANVSHGGIFVRTDVLPAPEDPIEVALQGTTPAIVLQARVRWAGPRNDGSVGFGAELIDPPEAYLELLRWISESRSPERGRRRVSTRVELSIPVAVEIGSRCDEGTLCDLSLGGARLERTGHRPPAGSRVSLAFALDAPDRKFEVRARVVRATSSGGYAVQFEAIDPRLKSAIEHLAGLARKLPL